MFLWTPPERTKKIKQMYGHPIRTKSDDIVKSVVGKWLPLKGGILTEIQRGIAYGEFIDNRDKLIELIRQDPGIYLFIARSLKNHVSNLRTGIEPLSALRELGQPELQQLFDVSPSQISLYKITDITKHQALHIQYSLAASYMSAELASLAGVERDVAYSASMLRQVGFNLLAWHFGDFFTRALTEVKEQRSNLETALDTLVGSNPLKLGQKIATSWGISAKLLNLYEPKLESPDKTIAEAGTLSLSQLCYISERYAQSLDPQHYPDGVEQWGQMALSLERRIPIFNISQLVRSNVADAIFKYAEDAPRLNVLSILEGKIKKDPDQDVKEWMRKSNPYVAKIDADLQHLFLDTYRCCRQQVRSEEAVKQLTDRLVLKCGFAVGCVIFIEGANLRVQSAITIGDIPLPSFGALLAEKDELALALNSLTPQIRHGRGLVGPDPNRLKIMGSFGRGAQSGILYLEHPETNDQSQVMVAFHALQYAFRDALGMGDNY